MKGGSLTRYRAMRSFDETPEPSGEARAKKKAPRTRKSRSFVIQEHDASHLHYDFRLELDGVLKSWAVPKGPSTVVGEKRLAVEVEDHPLAYGRFEGTIPKGHYGAGTVVIWDHGVWTPDEDPHEGLARGKLSFTLAGGRLKGRFALVRMKRAEKKPTWLLIKEHDDEDRGTSKTPSIASLHPELATLVDEVPTDKGWLVEPKLDGYRALARLQAGKAEIVSRTGHVWTARFSAIARALESLPIGSAIFDGEVCALDVHGHPSFGGMQRSASAEPDARMELVYFIFDLLFFGGEDLRAHPLLERKAALERVLRGVKAPLSYVRHVDGSRGRALFELARKTGMEGVVCKRAESAYVPRRTLDWVKVKVDQRQELVIVGYTAPKGGRQGLGALLLGVSDGKGALSYAGKVGTGFSASQLASLEKELRPLVVRKPAPANAPQMRDAKWVRPALVAEVSFTEWTRDGRLRHPVFRGLREDKPVKDVVREKASTLRRVRPAK
jgi:bifunctional non-homologous end joining protein LigD